MYQKIGFLVKKVEFVQNYKIKFLRKQNGQKIKVFCQKIEAKKIY